MPTATRKGTVQGSARPQRTPRVVRVRLTGRAQRFLAMLHDLGHIDEEDVTDILLSLQSTAPRAPRATADLDTVRSAVALMLFQDADASISGILGEDWPHLFS